MTPVERIAAMNVSENNRHVPAMNRLSLVATLRRLISSQAQRRLRFWSAYLGWFEMHYYPVHTRRNATYIVSGRFGR